MLKTQKVWVVSEGQSVKMLVKEFFCFVLLSRKRTPAQQFAEVVLMCSTGNCQNKLIT